MNQSLDPAVSEQDQHGYCVRWAASPVHGSISVLPASQKRGPDGLRFLFSPHFKEENYPACGISVTYLRMIAEKQRRVKQQDKIEGCERHLTKKDHCAMSPS